MAPKYFSPRISNSTWLLMMAVGIFFDIIQALINLIPVAGQFINLLLISPIRTVTLGFWFALHKVNYFFPKRKQIKLTETEGIKRLVKILSYFNWSILADFIPLLDILPWTSINIWRLVANSRKDDLLEYNEQQTQDLVQAA